MKIGDSGVEEVMSYVEVCDRIEAMIEVEESGATSNFTFKKLIDHQGPLTSSSKDWKGSQYNVKVLWEDNSETWEALSTMKVDDPITCAKYALEKGLLKTTGWKSLRKYAKNKKKLDRLLKQAKLKQLRREPIYKFGVRVPRDSKEARYLQTKEDHTKWTDAEDVELKQLNDYKVFHNLGHGAPIPTGYQRI